MITGCVRARPLRRRPPRGSRRRLEPRCLRIHGAWLFLAITAVAVSASPEADKAEEEGRWVEAATLRRAEYDSQGTRESARVYLLTLDAAGLDEELEQLGPKLASRFPGWDLPLRLAGRAAGRRGRPEAGAALLAPLGTAAAKADRAMLLVAAGRHADAQTLYMAVRSAPQGLPSPEERWARGRAAWALGAFEDASGFFETAYRESLGYLDARLDLARLFQEKYQENLAREELADALRLAPTHPGVNLAAAEINLSANQLLGAEAAARSVLDTRPRDGGACAVLATLALIADRPDEATAWLGGVLEQNPGDRHARSVQAAACYLAGDSTGWKRERDRVLTEDPGHLEVFLDLARILEMSRRNDEAFALYDAVLTRDPGNAEALINKGLLAMREGDESRARSWLEEGFAGDPFNIRAFNQLQLLDKMDTFASHRTKHFLLRYEAASDSTLIPLLARSLESTYADLVELHDHRPADPTHVEVFPSHDWFSARVTGLPWIGGIPAVCFGDVVAMDSPRTLTGETNWEEILRHEFGHVLALSMTRKKVPHWFTEGVSVHLERFPRGPAWDENLVAAYLDDRIIGLDSLTIGFTRPRDHNQRLLAYHESSLIVDDLVERHGWKAIPAILDAIGRGMGFPAALESATGESFASLRERVPHLVESRAAALPVWPTPSRERPQRYLRLVKAEPENRELRERLLLAQLQTGAPEETERTAKTLLEEDKDNPRAKGVLGLLAMGKNLPEEARPLLIGAFEAGSRDLPVLAALAEQDVALGDTAAALSRYDRSLQLYPEGSAARLARGRLRLARGDREGARADYRELLRLDASAGSGAVELARLELEDGAGAAAVQVLDYAVCVLPLDSTVEALRGQAYLLVDRDQEAYALFQRARKLDVRNVEVMVGLASYYLKQGDPEEAVYFADLALKYEPRHPQALAIRERARQP